MIGGCDGHSAGRPAALPDPLLPYLLRAGERAAEEAGRRIAGDAWETIKTLWPRLRARAPVRQAAQDLASTPDDPDAQAAFRYQLRRALTEDPALATKLAGLLQAREVHIYLHPVPPPAPEHPRPLHNLPNPDYLRFVGREKELHWLRQRLSSHDRAWLLFITGIGGVGKSALALHIAHEYRERYNDLPPQERFDAIVWASAKEQVLTPSGREPAGPPGLVSRTLADIYRAIAQALDREAITRAVPEDQDREVQKALTAQRTLLVLDNLDTMDNAVVQEYARSKLEREEWEAALVQRWLDWALEFAQKWVADLGIRIENLPIVVAEYPTLRRALAWCEEHRRWETFIPLVENLWFYPYLIGLLNETRQMLMAAIDAARLAGDERTAGRLLQRQGVLLGEQGEIIKGVESLNQAVAIARHYQDLQEVALGLERLSNHFSEMGNPEDAQPRAEEALAIGDTIGNLQVNVLAAYRLSMAESARGNLEASLEWLDQGEVWARELGWERALAWYDYRRGMNLIQNGRPAEAEPWLLKAMETMTWDEPRLIAYAKACLAQAYQALNRWEEARRAAVEALDLIDRIGLHTLRGSVERVLQELPGSGK
jgi:tetratricopeptide (TPR) repeat protein